MRFINFLLVFFLAFQCLALPQEQDTLSNGSQQLLADELKEDYEFSLKSPYHTVYSHLYFLQQDNFKPEVAGGVFNIENKKYAAELAKKLKQILDGEGLYVDMKLLPRDPDYTDNELGLHRYILFPAFPQIYVEKQGDNWYYSRRTAASIEEMHSNI
ncbi:MAG: hypothetical protein WD334_08885, partial [Chitinophagales bacterium]